MKTWQNKSGQSFNLQLTVPGYDAVKRELKADLLNPQDIAALTDDQMKTLRAIYILSTPVSMGIETAKPSFDQFAAGFDGDTLAAASNAFVGELLDFLPSRLSDPLRRLISHYEGIQTELQAHVDKLIGQALAAPPEV
ncbi:MAG: hypothetical protein KDA80_10805 [Planctomycetaceae bacterium]|nr:hypothetical protein [Planctomycetaceae bacterium]